MHASDCVLLETATEARIAGLLEDYRLFIEQPEQLIAQLQVLHPFHGSTRLAQWNDLIRAGEFKALVGELLELHYDPSYSRASSRHFQGLEHAKRIALTDLSAAKLAEIAAALQREA
jgi:tRNA 2-selenouridine synthase